MSVPRPCVVLLSCLLVLGAAAPASAARAKRPCVSALSERSPVVGAPASISGSVSPAVRRSVRLERRAGRRWVAVKTVRTSPKGAFRFAVPTARPGVVVLRVVAPARGKRRKLACSSLSVTVRPAALPATAPASGGATPGAAPGTSQTTPLAPDPEVTSPPPAPPQPGPGDSFRAIYGVAADQAIDPDHVAAIRHEIGEVNAWYSRETIGGVQPRWMRTSGVVDVEVVRLRNNAAAYEQGGLQMARDDVNAASPLDAPTQATVVYMDVTIAQQACGLTATNPPFVYIPEARCNNHPTTTSTFPGGGSYLLAHEMTHAFGALDGCSGVGSGHTTNDNRDVIYTGPNFQLNTIMLDPGRDDYYDSGRCGDIVDSRYWTKTPDPGS